MLHLWCYGTNWSHIQIADEKSPFSFLKHKSTVCTAVRQKTKILPFLVPQIKTKKFVALSNKINNNVDKKPKIRSEISCLYHKSQSDHLSGNLLNDAANQQPRVNLTY